MSDIVIYLWCILVVMWIAHVNTDIYNRLEISWWWNKWAESPGNLETKLAQWCKLRVCVVNWVMCRLIFEKCIQPRPSVSIIYISGDRNSWCQGKDLEAEVQKALAEFCPFKARVNNSISSAQIPLAMTVSFHALCLHGTHFWFDPILAWHGLVAKGFVCFFSLKYKVYRISLI